MCLGFLIVIEIRLHFRPVIDGQVTQAHDTTAMKTLNCGSLRAPPLTLTTSFIVTLVMIIAFSISSIANATATPMPGHDHIVVLSYAPGDNELRVRNIDGHSTDLRLPVYKALRADTTAANFTPNYEVLNPFIHTASYYAAFVLLTSTAVYFKNAELLTVTSLVGLPLLVVIAVRDLSKVLRVTRGEAR